MRHFAGDRLEVFSAGLEPSLVNPRAIQVMHEDDVDISKHTSKHVDQFIGQNFDYVITVCDNANERCPVFPGRTKRIHWSFEDPAAARGTETAILNKFREVRDKIKQKIKNFPDSK